MHDMRFFERNMMVAQLQPQSPWILFFDGATRDSENPNTPAGIGAVLKDSRGHTVVELKKLVGPGVSSGVAKYKALIAGLKKALSLGVEFLLVKGDSRLVHSQVVGHCSVQDDRLLDYQRKVLTLSKDFRALFLERISREDNLRADQLANDAIDEELQVVDSLSEFIDQEWTSQEKRASQQHSVHPHARPHTHHSSTHPAHPLPLPTSHLKVKPVASMSPHVVKCPAGAAAAAAKSTDSESRRSRLFSSDDEEHVELQMCAPPARNHVQAAAKSRRTTTGRGGRGGSRRGSCSPSSRRHLRRPEISSSLLQLWDSGSSRLEDLPFSEDSSGDCSGDGGAVTCGNLRQPAAGGEGNSASGSGVGGNVDGVAVGESARAETGSGSGGGGGSGSSESGGESESGDDGFCEEEYSRLAKTLLKGFMTRKKGSR